MTARRFAWIVLAALSPVACAQDFLDRVDEALTFSLLEDSARVRLSGTLDLEYFHMSEPPFGLVNTTSHDLFNPRLTLFLDAQLGSRVYLFVQARLDRGFDPSDNGAEVRLDEYAVRFTPWADGRLNVQIGKFAPVVGNWMTRHLSWDNPFVTAPLLYEHVTRISDTEVPDSRGDFFQAHNNGAPYEYTPIVWNADYASGVSISSKLGKFEFAAEMKNASLSSRPESWEVTEIGFEHPTFSARLGWRPTLAWNLGVSASHGTYLRPEAEPMLPRGRDIGDYNELVLAQDVGFATGHLQLWAEFYEARFEVPRVGNADTFAYYVEAKYKFSPEFFAAVRWNQQLFADVPDDRGGDAPWDHDTWRADAAAGYRFTPHTQLKFQYSFEHESGARGDSYLLGAQFTLRF